MTRISSFFQTSIQQVMIIHRDKEQAYDKALELRKWLEEKNLKIFICLQEEFLLDNRKTQKAMEKTDLAIVLGGDGTYLSAVHMLNGQDIPILGINMGSLGFLANTRMQDCYRVLSLIFEGKMEKRPRSMLRIQIQRKDTPTNLPSKELTALNDVVIERGSSSQLLHLSIKMEQKVIGQLKSDGVIVSSPTGSTAYNLSAGGPILHPMVQAFVCTPICPHSLTNRPIIFPEDRTLSLFLNSIPSKSSQAVLTVDGKFQTSLTPQDLVVVDKSPFSHYVLRDPKDNYFNLLKEKLNFSD